MSRLSVCFLLPLIATTLFTCGCKRSSDEVWNDTKTAGRHVSRGMKSLGGKHGDSRQVRSSAEFAGQKEKQDDYVAFEDEAAMHVSDEVAIKQPKETPGELGSSIPGIDAFKDPTPQLAHIFDNLHFEYNSSLIKGDSNLSVAQRITEWMKNNPRVYLFVEGHCDERGPAAYNFALGANRANAVRNFLIKDGISSDRIFTISYGKERPLILGAGEESWSLNRRAQFKIYEK